MRKVYTILLMSMMWLVAMAQSNYFFDMDALVASEGLYLPQNKPNPFNGSTDLYLAVVDEAEVSIVAADVFGHIEAQYAASLEPGVHRLHVTLRGKGTHVLGVHQNGKSQSIILLCNEGGAADRIEYAEFVEPIDLALYEELLNADKDEDFVAYGAIKTAKHNAAAYAGDFRVALSLSPFTLNQFEAGYTFKVGDKTATTPAELQQIYRDLGSTEMYVRLATKRHKTYKADGTLDNTTDGKPDENANVHTFDQVMQTCRIAASLNIPINPEVMCAYIYMDMDGTQAPRFYKSDYPELYASNPTWASILKNGDAKWEELSLDDICTVLEIYGEFVADSILATGAMVNDWNLGNEANFGFAGIGIGVPNSFDQTLASAGPLKRYMSSLFSLWWLKKHVWCYNAKQYAAVRRGILKAYTKAGKDTSAVRFSTHIATVTSTPRATASFFKYMAEHGYAVDVAGISYYPSAPAMSFNKKKMLTKTITRINKKCGLPVFIGEFSYPSQEMVGPFAGWNKQLGSYQKNQQGQADIYRDVIAWGKDHGMAGIRYWAPDYEGEWYPMSMFTFENKVGTAKTILLNHKEIVQ
ncbi:MAG: glycosyl hydrolase 53 family protein [Paludibacteraceae bacterium]|nr:glycosyl hydrolase 53 family protein [Paludibacteraceae bacterium]